jgi:hypothetical protein
MKVKLPNKEQMDGEGCLWDTNAMKDIGRMMPNMAI